MIYLDNAASTKPRKEVIEEMIRVRNNEYANPDAIHEYAHKTLLNMKNQKEKMARLLGLNSKEIYFTAGGSDGNNIIIQGIVEANNTTGVRITDLERTVIDSIRDFNKIGGLEELLNCLEGIHFLDEKKVLRYLEIYNTQGLYQRVGYLLQHYQKEMQLSNDFIDSCKEKIGKSRRYLLNEENRQNIYSSEWKLMIPEGLFEITEQGGDLLV